MGRSDCYTNMKALTRYIYMRHTLTSGCCTSEKRVQKKQFLLKTRRNRTKSDALLKIYLARVNVLHLKKPLPAANQSYKVYCQQNETKM